MPGKDKSKTQRCAVKPKQKVVEVQSDSESENEELAVIGRYNSFTRGEEEDAEVLREVEENEEAQNDEAVGVEEGEEGDESEVLKVEEGVDNDVVMEEADNAESEVTEETEANIAGRDGDMAEIFGESDDEEEFEGFADEESVIQKLRTISRIHQADHKEIIRRC